MEFSPYFSLIEDCRVVSPFEMRRGLLLLCFLLRQYTNEFCHNHLHHCINTAFFTVSGMCHGISKGSRTITYTVSTCSGYNPTEAYTGWQSSFHIIAEELRADLIKNCGSGTPVNCDD
mgnify:CR=1 FL=1